MTIYISPISTNGKKFGIYIAYMVLCFQSLSCDLHFLNIILY